MANNWGGWQVTRHLRKRGDQVVGLITHPGNNAKFRAEILDVAHSFPIEYLTTADDLREPEIVAALRALKPDITLLAFFGYILRQDVIEIPPAGTINLHTGYLPHNRGWHPNVYPFLDGSPAGVAIHYVNAGIDTGDLIVRRRVPVAPTDTGGDLHQRLTVALVELFKESWPLILGDYTRRNPQEGGNHHYRAEMRGLERIDLDKKYPARWLLGLLRGLTYPPYPAAYYQDPDTGQRIYVRVELLTEEDLEAGAVPDWTYARLNYKRDTGCSDPSS
jgi:methionyl-tRNA formyltransferase